MWAEAANLSDVFAALGDGTRLALVSRLCARGPMSLTRLASGSPMTRQAITKHLHVLEGAGLVRSARRGREQIWSLKLRELARAQAQLAAIARGWDDRLRRLKALVEDGR